MTWASGLGGSMKYLCFAVIIGVVVFSCVDVGYRAIEKHHRKQDPKIVFYRKGAPVFQTRTTVKDAEALMRSNNFDMYEVDE